MIALQFLDYDSLREGVVYTVRELYKHVGYMVLLTTST